MSTWAQPRCRSGSRRLGCPEAHSRCSHCRLTLTLHPWDSTRWLAIELAHGVGVSWDGRVHRHCTAVPRHIAPRDLLYALFLGQYTRVANASERADLRMALRAQVKARRQQHGPGLDVGSVVWAKHSRGRRSRRDALQAHGR